MCVCIQYLSIWLDNQTYTKGDSFEETANLSFDVRKIMDRLSVAICKIHVILKIDICNTN